MSELTHETDEQLELYALGRLPELRQAAVEEHLLVCATCQEHLDEVEAFAVAMRDAIASEPAHAENPSWFGWLRQPIFATRGFAWVGAFAACALLLASFLYFGRPAGAPLASLQLTAIRGETPSVELARETDIALADAPSDGLLRAEVIDTNGAQQWAGTLSAGNTRRLKVTRQLRQGDYLVRLFDESGKLLHEYGFRVRNTL